MKVILQKDLYDRSREVFKEASEKYGIEYFITDILDEPSMIRFHEKGASCFVIGAEAYSKKFYESIAEGSAVIRYGVGYDEVPVEICKKRFIKVAYTPGTLTDSVAEHTIALLLGLMRNIPALHNSMKKGQWKGASGYELKNKTLAILGFGQIGQATARIAKNGFGMKINVFDKEPGFSSSLYDLYSINYQEVVCNADVISIHLKALPETIGFVNERRIRQMKDGAVLINTSRGEIIEEKDLFQALDNGKLAAAALDVFVDEPYNPKPETDFRQLNNVLLSPHCGSNTKEANDRMAELVIKNILAYYKKGTMNLIPEITL